MTLYMHNMILCHIKRDNFPSEDMISLHWRYDTSPCVPHCSFLCLSTVLAPKWSSNMYLFHFWLNSYACLWVFKHFHISVYFMWVCEWVTEWRRENPVWGKTTRSMKSSECEHLELQHQDKYSQKWSVLIFCTLQIIILFKP